MNGETRNIMIVVALTIAILLMALIIFFTLGSDIALWFAMIGVPAIFITLVVALIVMVRMPGDEIKIKKKELESITHKFLNVKTKVTEIGMVFNVDTDRAEFELKGVETALKRQGCVFKGKLVKYDMWMLKRTKLAEISNISKELEEIMHKVADALYDAIREEINRYVEELDKLNACGYEVEDAISSLNSISASAVKSDLSALEKLSSDTVGEVKSALERCIGKMRETVSFTKLTFASSL